MSCTIAFAKPPRLGRTENACVQVTRLRELTAQGELKCLACGLLARQEKREGGGGSVACGATYVAGCMFDRVVSPQTTPSLHGLFNAIQQRLDIISSIPLTTCLGGLRLAFAISCSFKGSVFDLSIVRLGYLFARSSGAALFLTLGESPSAVDALYLPCLCRCSDPPSVGETYQCIAGP